MDKLTWFILLTGIAVALQAGVLLAMYIAMRKSSERMEALATEIKTKVLPTVEQVNGILTDLRPKVEVVVENLQGATSIIRGQVERVDATVNDVIDRARLQIIRGDELLSRTLDRVEQTSEVVQRTVVSPVKHLTGLVQGITVGLEFLFSRGRRNGSRERRPVPQDEMFI
jgi:hypothetical protein